MSKLRLIAIGAGLMTLSGCVTGTDQTATAEQADLNPCLTQVMDFMEGNFDYTGTIARVSGGYRTFVTTSKHERLDDGTWEYSSVGGDLEEPSASNVRLVGNQFLTRSGDDEAEAARTFTSCEGPNEVGRITTISYYTLPPLPDETEELNVEILSLYSESGGYFTETISNQAGAVIAYRSGVSVKTETE